MDCLRVNANFTGCVVDLATWMDLCYRVWQLWRQKINRITRSFMKADLAGKTGEHMAGQVLSRSDRSWQWLYLGCSERCPSTSSQQPNLCEGCQVSRGKAHQMVVGLSAKYHTLKDKTPARKMKTYCLFSAQESKRWLGTSLRTASAKRKKFIQVQLIWTWHGL